MKIAQLIVIGLSLCRCAYCGTEEIAAIRVGGEKTKAVFCVYVEVGNKHQKGYYCLDNTVGDIGPFPDTKLFPSIAAVNQALLNLKSKTLVIDPYWNPANTPSGWKIRSLTKLEMEQFTVPHRLPRYTDADIKRVFGVAPIRE